jgi:hypothetical protein
MSFLKEKAPERSLKPGNSAKKHPKLNKLI